MSNENTLGEWLDNLDTNFGKYKPYYEIMLAFALAIFPVPFGAFVSLVSGDRMMTGDPILSAPSLISIVLFYVIAFCAWMLIRNSSKTGVNRKIDELTESHNKLISKIDELINEIRQERNERNNREKKGR